LAYGGAAQHWPARDRAWFQDGLERIRLDPRTHRILEFEALHRVVSGQVQLPEHLQRDVVRIVAQERPTDALGAAVWHEFETRAASAGQRSIARVMLRSYALAAELR